MSRSGVAALCVAFATASAARSAAASPCRVEASVEPAVAVVGQQVLYRARIYSLDEVVSVEWEHPPAFASFRTENLPGDPRPGRLQRDGLAYHVRDELRALFADREGSFVLRAPDLLCHVGESRSRTVPVPDARITIEPFPTEGRPDDFAGIVGTLSLLVTVTPREVALGETLRVAVMARGTGNLWDLTAPFSPADFGSAEFFARRPERVLERGRELFLREHYVYDVVPRDTGELHVPPISIPYFDPGAGRYRAASAEAVRVPVRARAATAPPKTGTPFSRSPQAAPSDGRAPGGARGVALVALLVALLTGGLWWWRRRGPDPAAEARALARSAGSAEDPDDRASALARALRTALLRCVSDAGSVTPEELLARSGLPEPVASAARLLASLERARFDPGAPPPDAEAVLRAIGELSGARGSAQ